MPPIHCDYSHRHERPQVEMKTAAPGKQGAAAILHRAGEEVGHPLNAASSAVFGKMRRPREEDEVAAGLIGPGRRWDRSDIGADICLRNWCDDPGRRIGSPRVRSATGGGVASRTSVQAFACELKCGNTMEEDWCCRVCYRPREEVGPRKNLRCRKRLASRCP